MDVSDIRDVEAKVCKKLGIAKVLPPLLEGVVESGKGHEEYPPVASDPAAFDLVVEKLGEAGHVVSFWISGISGAWIGRIEEDDGFQYEGTGDDHRKAVCRAVLEMEDP